jgi:hypothetical protein
VQQDQQLLGAPDQRQIGQQVGGQRIERHGRIVRRCRAGSIASAAATRALRAFRASKVETCADLPLHAPLELIPSRPKRIRFARSA